MEVQELYLTKLSKMQRISPGFLHEFHKLWLQMRLQYIKYQLALSR